MHEVLVNRLGGLSLPRKSVVRLTDRPDMTLDVYRGRKTTKQQLSPQITQRENNIVCIYNYVNMSNRVSIVKTDFGWSEEWLQEVIIVQKASLYI